MLRSLVTAFVLVLSWQAVSAQEFIPLWDKDKPPNSRGLKLEDKVDNERVQQVGTPGIYAFFPSAQENTGAAVVICPGGGYAHLAYVTSGTQLAKWFNSIGVSAFVLKYRLPESPDLIERHIAPLQDAQRAMRIVRSRAGTWGIKPDRIGVSPVITMGEHAHAGSRTRLLGDSPPVQLIEKYSMEKQVTTATPPAFVVHAGDDQVVSVRNSLMFYEALADKRVPASLHIFPHGGHAIALRNNPGSTETWTRLCALWLVEMGFVQRERK